MDQQPRPKRSQVGIDLVRRISSDGHRIFSMKLAREISKEAGLKPAYLREALYHLRRTGWIIPLRRGLYAISADVPGVAPVHEFEIAMALVVPSRARIVNASCPPGPHDGVR
jgi:predicted transcriptional regulator of viral defense system